MTTEAWLSVAVALAVGLLVGSERERSGHGEITGGVRTFALAALAGCLAALWGPAPLAAAAAGAAILAAASFLRRVGEETGLTTEVALVLVVLLGGAAAYSPALAAGAGVATAVLLVSKERLHRFVRQTVTDVEVTDALKFFVVALIVLPLIPHANLGPYGVIDPRRIWTLVVVVTGLSWLGYLAVRILGPGRGLPLAGLAGGFVSGAVTTGAMARHARQPGIRRSALAGALMASVATLIQLVAVTALVDVATAKLLVPAALAGAVVLVVEAAWLARKRRGGNETETQEAPEAAYGRPFAFLPALILAAVLSAILVLARFAEDKFGSAGTFLAISISGLADSHAGALTAATLASSKILTPATAAVAALSAVAVNTVVKMVLAGTGGGWVVAWRYAALIALPTVAVAIAAVITLGVA